MTGTFDGWSKSEKLVKTGDSFSKDVTLNSAAEKIYYKVRGEHISIGLGGHWVSISRRIYLLEHVRQSHNKVLRLRGADAANWS